MKYKIWIDKIIILAIQVLVFLVPLYFAFLYKDYSVFTLDKTAVFQISVEILLILTLLKIVINRVGIAINNNVILSDNEEPRQSTRHLRDFSLHFASFKMTVGVVSLFFLIFAISTIFSIDSYHSFWGSFYRKQGLVVYIHYFVFFLLLLFNFIPSKKEDTPNKPSNFATCKGEDISQGGHIKKINKIISATLLGSFFVSSLGILQWLGYDPLPWQERIPIFGRITSTMGQPIFLANYLLFVIPLAVYRIYDSRFTIQDLKKMTQSDFLILPFSGGVPRSGEGVVTMKQRLLNNTKLIRLIFFITLLILQLTTLMFTYTRGAIIGLVFGIFFFAFFYPLVIKKNKKAFFKSILLFLLSILLIIFLIMSTRGGWNYSDRIYWRMKNVINLEHGSTALRVKYWTAALDAIKKKPFLGYGAENQQDVFMAYYDKTWIPFEKPDLVPDKAHNEYLDIALSGGLLLLFSYLLMLFCVFYGGLKAVFNSRNKQGQVLLILILSALFSYSVSMFFAFSVVELSTFFYLFLALVLILSSSKSLRHSKLHPTVILNDSEESRQSSRRSRDSSLRSTSLGMTEKNNFKLRVMCYVLCVPCFMLCVMCYMNINMVRADYHFREARSAFVDKRYLKMYENYIKTFELNDKERYYKQSFVDDAIVSMFSIDSPQYNQAIISYLYNILESYEGTSFNELLVKAKIYMILGKFEDKKYLDKALLLSRDMVERSPYLAKTHLSLAQVYIERGEYKQAIETFEYVLSFLPHLDSEKLNREHREEIEKLMKYIKSRIEYCNKQKSD